jgi:hypothetical protein
MLFLNHSNSIRFLKKIIHFARTRSFVFPIKIPRTLNYLMKITLENRKLFYEGSVLFDFGVIQSKTV